MVCVCVCSSGLWAVVNNAGVATPAGPWDWVSFEDYRDMMEVNMDGVVAVTLSVLQLIKKARGRVVNVASVFGRISPTGGAYCISKHGVESFTDSLRWGHSRNRNNNKKCLQSESCCPLFTCSLNSRQQLFLCYFVGQIFAC